MSDQGQPRSLSRRPWIALVAVSLALGSAGFACQLVGGGNGGERQEAVEAGSEAGTTTEAERREPGGGQDERPGRRPAGEGGGRAAAVDEFEARVREYAALRSRLAAEIGQPAPPATTEDLKKFETALRAAIAEARSDVARGAVLSEPVVSHFRETVRHVLESDTTGGTLRGMIEETPKLGEVPLEVNGRYPDAAMLSTVPPSLLEALPRLPEDIQYRFVGCQLILLDAQVSIIVDYADDCLW